MAVESADLETAAKQYAALLAKIAGAPPVLDLVHLGLGPSNKTTLKYAGVAKGACVLADSPDKNPELILIASGSEVSLAVQAHEELVAEGIRSRVVSMQSWDIFDYQPKEYRDSVLPPDVKARVAIEQASTFGWERHVGDAGRVIGMRTFGASAPLKELQEKFGFEPNRVGATAKELARPRLRPARCKDSKTAWEQHRLGEAASLTAGPKFVKG
jgi:transketolase